MTKRRKIVRRIALAIAIGLIVIWLGRAWTKARRVAGIYLAEGGTGCLVIARRWGFFLHAAEKLPDWGMRYKLVIHGKGLGLYGRITPQFAGQIPVELSWHSAYLLEPSQSNQDDWDLVATGLRMPGGMRQLANPNNPPVKDRVADAMDQLLPKHPRTQPLKRRLPYLHRLDDVRIVDYFVQQTVTQSPAVAFLTARELLDDHPDDLYVRSLYLNAAAHNGDVDAVTRKLDAWREDFSQSDDPFLEWSVRRIETWLRAERLSAAGRNAFDLCQRLFGPNMDLPTRIRSIPRLLEMEAFVIPALPNSPSTANPNFLDMLTGIKVARVMAIFLMLEGKREESLRLLASGFRLGQMMRRDMMFIGRLIGTGFQTISCDALAIYALNCCETEAEFRDLWRILEQLEAGQATTGRKELLALDSPMTAYTTQPPLLPDFLEAETRFGVADASFELIRMAAAARFRFVTQGAFPTAAGEFGALLPNGLPNDPFSENPLLFYPTTDSLVCYSVGPDKTNDRVQIEYDPTNGTVSPGDILLKVPRNRRYPFPRDGVRAASVDDLMRQFPNGFSQDPFSTTRPKSLGTTATSSGEIYIYSYGPDVNEFKPRAPRAPNVRYDPTNGTTSAGDLFIRIPRP